MRLIDADALLEMIYDHRCADCESVKADQNGIACAACQWDDAISMIENAPTMAVIEQECRVQSGSRMILRNGVAEVLQLEVD